MYDVEDDERDIQDLKHLHLNPDNGAGSTSATTVTPIEDEDVLTERRRVLSGAADNEVVRIQELRKIYPANSKAGGIDPLAIFRVALRKSWRAISASVGADTNTGASGVKATGQKNYKVAVQSLCFGIPKGQCFGFLGKWFSKHSSGCKFSILVIFCAQRWLRFCVEHFVVAHIDVFIAHHMVSLRRYQRRR